MFKFGRRNKDAAAAPEAAEDESKEQETEGEKPEEEPEIAKDAEETAAAPPEPKEDEQPAEGGEAKTASPEDDEAPPMNAEEETEDARTSLENTVRARDKSISVLEKARLEKQQELDAIQKELDEERLRQMKEAILHRIETERLKRQTKAVKDRLKALEKDMQDKDAIHEYANLIKGVAPQGGVDSQYVMKLQTQLAKAVKKMDATSRQMTKVEESCEEVVMSLKNEIADVIEDRCRTELELRKQLELLDEQKSDMQADYEARIRENQQEIERLKERALKEMAVEDLEKQLEEADEKIEELKDVRESQKEELEEAVAASKEVAAAAEGD